MHSQGMKQVNYIDLASQITTQKDKIVLHLDIKTQTEAFIKLLHCMLFNSSTVVLPKLKQLELDFFKLVRLSSHLKYSEQELYEIWNAYTQQFPSILEKLHLDAQAFLDNDPAVNSLEEVYLAYPGFYAITVYRLSHPLYLLKVPILPRLLTEYAHCVTGTDISPGARIGKSFFIDHATGVVIGETCIIKDHVSIYQGVTLGGLTVKRSLKNSKRHPTIENHVTIYANATILGGDTVIGENSTIGGNAWITKSVAPNSLVLNVSETTTKTKKK